MKPDTSAEAVEQMAAFHALSVDRYHAEEESGLRACAHMTAATLRALVIQRNAMRLLMEEAAEEILATITATYAGTEHYPDQARRKDRDMDLVRRLRAAGVADG